jgi:putative phosphotransacetylase
MTMPGTLLIDEIVERVLQRIADADPAQTIVGISNRHVHLDDADFYTLFGYAKPTVKKYVRQRGEFAAEETVTLHGPRGHMDRVRVMGPNRPATQVELSRTDCFALGVAAPMAQSGSLAEAGPIEIEGPVGRVVKDHAAIVAGRHIHMGPDDAAKLGLTDQDRVSVVFGGERGGRLDHFLVRVKENFLLELHLDTDEGNAIGARTGDYVTICDVPRRTSR